MKNESKAKKKLISQYQKTKKENEKLQSEIEDLKITLNINQDLLYQIILTKLGDNAKNLINKSKTLWKESESLIEKKNNIEIETEHLQKEMEQIPVKINDEINNISVTINKKKNDLMSKDSTIKKLKIELGKTRKSAFFKTARTEVFVTEPTKFSVDINEELLNTKNILTKVSNMHTDKKKKSDKLGKEVKNLKDEMIKLKKNAIRLYKKINNINDNNNQIKESNNNNQNNDNENIFLKNLGYNTLADVNLKEDEEEEEEEESEESSDESNSDEAIDNKNKKKQNEFENLNEQLNKLREQNKQ